MGLMRRFQNILVCLYTLFAVPVDASQIRHHQDLHHSQHQSLHEHLDQGTWYIKPESVATQVEVGNTKEPESVATKAEAGNTNEPESVAAKAEAGDTNKPESVATKVVAGITKEPESVATKAEAGKTNEPLYLVTGLVVTVILVILLVTAWICVTQGPQTFKGSREQSTDDEVTSSAREKPLVRELPTEPLAEQTSDDADRVAAQSRLDLHEKERSLEGPDSSCRAGLEEEQRVFEPEPEAGTEETTTTPGALATANQDPAQSGEFVSKPSGSIVEPTDSPREGAQRAAATSAGWLQGGGFVESAKRAAEDAQIAGAGLGEKANASAGEAREAAAQTAATLAAHAAMMARGTKATAAEAAGDVAAKAEGLPSEAQAAATTVKAGVRDMPAKASDSDEDAKVTEEASDTVTSLRLPMGSLESANADLTNIDALERQLNAPDSSTSPTSGRRRGGSSAPSSENDSPRMQRKKMKKKKTKDEI